MSTKSMPDIIYHYTSNEVLLKILSAKSFRMSSSHHLNDSTEGEQFFSVLPGHRSGPNSAKIASIRKSLDAFDFFVTCFSAKSDLLSQWRGYAKNGSGVSIGFRKQSIVDAIRGSYDLLLYQVTYANTIGDLSSATNKTIDAIISSSGTPSDEALKSFAKERWAIKQAGFSEEQESRLILTIDASLPTFGSSATGLEVGYFASDTEVREYVDFKFGYYEDIEFIESITLGPTNRTNEDALKRHLNKIGFGAVDVKRSCISYR